MPTEILPIAATAGTSADVVIAPGNSLTVCLKSASPPTSPNGRVGIELQSDVATNYFRVDELTAPGRAALVIVAPGTYRFVRVVNGAACGVFSG
jgi:hypothetical protein